MRKVILSTVMLSMVSIIGAIEIPESRNGVLREAQRAIAMTAGVNFSEDEATGLIQEVRRQMDLQNGGRVGIERMEITMDLIMKNIFIKERSADLLHMNLRDRHVTVSALYTEKFKPFQEMFRRQDLGVKATMADLEAVGEYVENTKVVLEQVMIWLGSDPSWCGMTFCLSWLGHGWESNITARTILGNYQAGKAAYDRQQARLGIAKDALFPSASFDMLVDDVNLFYRDMTMQLACFRSWRALLPKNR